MAEETSPSVQPLQPQFERDEDFASLYANHVWYEPSVWDLKLIFGELDQSRGPNAVTQHTAIALSWIQAKIMSYYLQVNIAAYEVRNGKIKVPADVVPRDPGPAPPELESDPLAKPTSDRIREIRARFIESL